MSNRFVDLKKSEIKIRFTHVKLVNIQAKKLQFHLAFTV